LNIFGAQLFLKQENMKNHKIKILYIAGAERIGSTLVGNILGQIPGFFFVSEAISIWKRFVLGDGLCGCGFPGMECEIWGKVLSQTYEGDLSQFAEKMMHWQLHSTKNRHVPMLWVFRHSRWFQNRFRGYLEGLERLYRETQFVTGCQIIVDSSKNPKYAVMLGLIPTIDLYVIHLVRDPRAVAFSWQRRKFQREFGGQRQMRTIAPLSSGFRWQVVNWVTELFWRISGHYMRLCYEDMVEEPQKAVSAILEMIGEKPAKLPFVDARTVRLGVNHAIWGNPNRYEIGDVTLRLDDEWQSRMKATDRVIVDMVTWPYRKKYGYK
jgi:hypothetical protein